jgi:hypothetical protein
MKKITRLTESDLNKLVRRIINEQLLPAPTTPKKSPGAGTPPPTASPIARTPVAGTRQPTQTTKLSSCKGGEQGILDVISWGNTSLWTLSSSNGKQCIVSENEGIRKAYLMQKQGPMPTMTSPSMTKTNLSI